ncbi:MAG: PTS lactose/cellobiose transporter subunit IIA [Eubacterium sp.]
MSDSVYSEAYEQICFQLITASGGAKSAYMAAIGKAKEGAFNEARALIREGDRCLAEAHRPHADMVQKEAAGRRSEMTLILAHAEDQMMSTEIFKAMAEEFISLYEKLIQHGLLEGETEHVE